MREKLCNKEKVSNIPQRPVHILFMNGDCKIPEFSRAHHYIGS